MNPRNVFQRSFSVYLSSLTYIPFLIFPALCLPVARGSIYYIQLQPGLGVAHAYNPNPWEAETGELPYVRSQPGLHGETLSQKREKKKDQNVQLLGGILREYTDQQPNPRRSQAETKKTRAHPHNLYGDCCCMLEHGHRLCQALKQLTSTDSSLTGPTR